MPNKYTEREMLELLHQRYSKDYIGTASRFVCAEHVPIGARIADFIALDRYTRAPNYKPLMIGHEVKVSRSDWLSELRCPEKSEVSKKFMDQWYLVVPDRSIVKSRELPAGWGLMALGKTGLRVTKKAPLLNPVELDTRLVAGFSQAAVRTAYRAAQYRTAPIYLEHYEQSFSKPYREPTPHCQWCGAVAPCKFHPHDTPNHNLSRLVNP